MAREKLPLPLAGERRKVPRYDERNMARDLALVARNQVADTITGGLSWPRKMPCAAWGLPAEECKTGSKLAQVEGTVCRVCYALKGNFVRDAVRAKLYRCLEGIFHPQWPAAMAFL